MHLWKPSCHSGYVLRFFKYHCVWNILNLLRGYKADFSQAAITWLIPRLQWELWKKKKNQPPPMNIFETPIGGVNQWLARGRLQGTWKISLGAYRSCWEGCSTGLERVIPTGVMGARRFPAFFFINQDHVKQGQAPAVPFLISRHHLLAAVHKLFYR